MLGRLRSSLRPRRDERALEESGSDRGDRVVAAERGMREHARHHTDERFRQYVGRDVSADAPCGATAVEQSPERCSDQPVELVRLEVAALAREDHEPLALVDERTDRSGDTLLDGNLVDSRTDEPLVHIYAEGETEEDSIALEAELRGLVEEILQSEEAAARV